MRCLNLTWSSIRSYISCFPGPPTTSFWYVATSCVYLSLISLLHQNDLSRASRKLVGSPPIFYSTSSDLISRYNLSSSCTWALLALKDRDISSPTANLTASLPDTPSQEVLEQWLLENRLPTTVELTHDTFQDVMKASHRPLVVVVAATKDSRDKVYEKLKDIGKVWRMRRGSAKKDSRDVVFTWMDMGRWGSFMKSMYGISSSSGAEPSVVIADHGRLVYYDTDQSGQPVRLTSTSIFSAIEGISNGRIKPKHSENVVERFARYLNGKLSSLESLVSDHLGMSLMLLGLLVVIVGLSLRHCVKGDERSYEKVKSGRLD